MRGGALALAYHAVETGPAPLCTDPALLREHLDVLADCGARTLTVSELAAALAGGELPERGVAITFDDGFASVAEQAAPLLAERGQRATVFCVAGAVGGVNDWPSQPRRAPRRPLADALQLRELADAGLEIGSHGVDHAPLAGAPAAAARWEVVESRAMLEELLQRPVTSFAYPYGAVPGGEIRALLRQTYEAACTTELGTVRAGTDPFRIPRVDVHYVRRPDRLRRALEGSLGGYLRLRRAGARSRRLVRKDYLRVAAR
jgi:peptidoglycan/xylan/chitin deacetylase (PgdA/CDA1 family)